MKKLLAILFLIPLCVSAANGTLSSKVAQILKLNHPAEALVDSAFYCILYYTDDDLMEQYRTVEDAMDNQLMPFALKNEINDSLMAYLYDEWAMSKMRQGPGKHEEFMPLFEAGIKYAVKAKDHFRHGRLLEHQGFHEIKYGDLTKGFGYSQQAIDAYRQSLNDADRQITRCYYMQAITYMNLADFDGLLTLIDNMNRTTSDVRDENRTFHLYNLYSIEDATYANLLMTETDPAKRKEYAEAIDRASLNAIRLIEDAPDEWELTSINPAWNYHNRASHFVNFSERPPMDSVLYYAAKALGRKSKNESDAIELRISCDQTVAEGWLKNGNYQKAKEMLMSTLEMIKSQPNVNNLIQDRVMVYDVLRDMASQTGQFAEALSYADSARTIEHERFSLEKATAIKDLEIKYKTKETELALSRSEAHRATVLVWLFGVSAALLLAIAIIIIFAGRARRRSMQRKIEIAEMKAEASRRMAREYIEGLEFERRRMARELHDGVCNDLLAIQMGLKQNASRTTVTEQIGDCREALRRMSHQLMPPEFLYANLDEVVRFFVDRQAAAHPDISFSYNNDNDADWTTVPDTVALEIYRIIQEAISNAIKHSGCSKIIITLRLSGSRILVNISDNGRFKPQAEGGIGLKSIRRRTDAINGTLIVDTDPSQGTSLTLDVVYIDN